MSEPVRFLGLTLDEGVLVFLGLSGSFAFEAVSLKLFSLFAGLFGVVVLKRAKRQRVGINLKSFLYWHGLSFRLSGTFPKFEHRFYLS